LESQPEAMQRLLFDPQTSGGLLMAVEPQAAAALVEQLRADGLPAAVVGYVREGEGLSLES
jgi:selenide, water dikinase